MAEKILVVDDDPETVEFMTLLLVRQGYQVIPASSGLQALNLARTELPDVIVLDIMMPGTDGFEVARSLKRNAETSVIPILMFTARVGVEDKIKGYEAGVDIYLTKPAHPMDLNAHIKALVVQRKARKVAISDHGYIVGVISPKGGLGVSTVTLNLAVTYAKKYGGKVIAAEMRPGQGTWADELYLSHQGGLDQLLKLDPADISSTVVDSQLTPTNFGVRLLLAPSEPCEPGLLQSPAQFEALVSVMSSMSPFVFLDIGTQFHPNFTQLLSTCDEIIVVIEPQPLPVKQTGRLLELLRGSGFGSTRPVTLITLNHTRSDSSLSITQVENLLQRSITLGFPPALELAAHAIRQGVPMVNAQVDNVTVQQYVKLAETIQTHSQQAAS